MGAQGASQPKTAVSGPGSDANAYTTVENETIGHRLNNSTDMFEDFVDVMPLRRAWREILRYLGILLLGMTVCRCTSINL